jgi:hypothetical protein
VPQAILLILANSAYSGYPELWILRYPAHRYHAVPSPGFEPTTLWLRVRRHNHSATTLHIGILKLAPNLLTFVIIHISQKLGEISKFHDYCT